ncbi:N-formylglutamate amidohydrolase [Phyllobacterium zundukense]|uniref:N-formylglutamate amidohydrolase n=1 Tax=Phyllobacterium zundukense TaxID=1867719 RepID=A0A2N9W1B1_9HYPH|nr:N-formylglutamate amidohydrolase [Phyllobacterium zundukense]ATU95371.1 N-formylglutamate amidohydrolase [Phyllobacterium zundukense]PIO45529.1 N-formylglutamate amidohydrolase [Phyllobacterium zundukense]
MKQGYDALDLLTPDDPAPVDVVNPDGSSPVLLVCEHAGQAIPASLRGLGITREVLNEHVGWDIGAAAVARLLAQQLDAVAILQPYSRLVIDCNRPPDASDAIPAVSDGMVIPGNQDIANAHRMTRKAQIFEPFHAEIDRHLDSGRHKLAISIHSFTPCMNNVSRPWDIGFLFRFDTKTSEYLRKSVTVQSPDIVVGMNEPYEISDTSDWFVPRHAEARGIDHSLIEIRNDHLRTIEGQRRWADIVARSIEDFLNEDQR